MLRCGGSHHVRLYSQTKSAALTAISHCVTFSPSPWFCCFLPACAGRLRGLELFVGLEDGVNTKPVNLGHSRHSAAAAYQAFSGGHTFVVQLSTDGFVHKWPASYLQVLKNKWKR